MKALVLLILASGTILSCSVPHSNRSYAGNSSAGQPSIEVPTAGPVWKEAFSMDLDYQAPPPKANPNDGAPGAPGAHALAINIPGARAGAVVDRVEGKGVGVFIGLTVDDGYDGDVSKDIRVRFTDTKGKVHESAVDAHVTSLAMLFHSPDNKPAWEIKSFSVVYDETAKWVKPKKSKK